MDQHSAALSYAFLFLLLLLLARQAALRAANQRRTIPIPALPKDYKAWPLPVPEPPEFELQDAQELALRPFRWGKHRLTMGIKPLNPVDWLSLHKSYPAYAKLREARHEVYASRSYQVLSTRLTPGALEHVSSSSSTSSSYLNELAALELARSIAAYLACRYPRLFRVQPPGAERRQDGFDVRSVTRLALPHCGMREKTWMLGDLGAEGQGADEAMRTAGELVPDDLVLLRETDLTEQERAAYQSEKAPFKAHRFIAGSICTAGFWTLKDKLGLPLREIHTRGGVPQYDEKCESRGTCSPRCATHPVDLSKRCTPLTTAGAVPVRDPMDRFFSKLKPDKPVGAFLPAAWLLQPFLTYRMDGNLFAERIDNFFFQICDTEAIPALLSGELVPEVLSGHDERSIPISGRRYSSEKAEEGRRELFDRAELSWSHTTNGPEDRFDQMLKGPRTELSDAEQQPNSQSGLPSLRERQKEEEKADAVLNAPTATKETDAASICMRAERQTLRRLPRSGAIVFTIRTYLTPITSFAAEPGVPGRLAASIRAWPEDTARYKGAGAYAEAALGYLDDMHARQVQQGLVDDWDVDRLALEREQKRADKAFPFA